MTFKECSRVSEREAFVHLASLAGSNMSLLCARFGISRKTGYRWLHRHLGGEPMTDRSRRPHESPSRTASEMEQLVLSVRAAHPGWGGRKIARRLADLGHAGAPCPSTITSILHRHDQIEASASAERRRPQRFEHAYPNALWQMDFKGHFALGDGSRCHPLTVLDDHSRYSLAVRACGDERGLTVRAALTLTFERYGLPQRILCDNGPPWGTPDAGPRGLKLTKLTVWLLRVGVEVTHGRPHHPQTQGKDERFNRTLDIEVIQRQLLADLLASGYEFDRFQHCYNFERPHEALGLATPGSLYRPSPRSLPSPLPPLAYAEREVRQVDADGHLSYRGRRVRVTRALAGQPVGLRPTLTDGLLEVVFAGWPIGELDTRAAAWLVCSASTRCARSSGADQPLSNV